MALRIPAPERNKLLKLINLDEAAMNSLREALLHCTPQLGSGALVKVLSSKVRIERSTLADIIGLLLSLFWIREEHGVDARIIARDVALDARTTRDEQFDLSDIEIVTLERRLAELLSVDGCLSITAKARFVAYQSPRVYRSARIFTDARPIFSRDAAGPPSAFVVTHTLKIDINENGKDQEWFAALDSRDLKALKGVVDRALEKEESLKKLLSRTEVPILDSEVPSAVGDAAV